MKKKRINQRRISVKMRNMRIICNKQDETNKNV